MEIIAIFSGGAQWKRSSTPKLSYWTMNRKGRESLKEIIGSWGISAEGFARHQTAIEYILENDCDLLLLNISPSNVSDLELIPQLEEKDLKVVITTESADKDMAIRALKLGAFDLLEKPFGSELLHHSISRALAVLETQRRSKELTHELDQSRIELLARQRRLEKLNVQLYETNKALSVLARNIEREREEMESQIALRLRNLLMPIVTKLRSDKDFPKYETQLDMLTWHLEDLTSGVSIDPSVAKNLSSAEMRIASLVKNGVSTEEIARQLHISANTVRSHRRSIRKKLKINGQYSLRNFLDSRSGPHRQVQSGKPLYVQ